MSSIDQVIAAARREGGFSERKTFKLARKRAIEKMRKFALADPYFYVLELIQAAVAHRAIALDLRFEDGDATISYIGHEYLREDELSQLFDFLFASKDRLDLAHLRSLALGINAALRFEPTRVIIESGDGTRENTSRLVLTQGAESVEVGRSDRGLGGTFIRLEGLDRRKIKRETGRYGDEDGNREHSVIESRCLTAPVPIVFNEMPMFGFGSQRIPGIVGYQQALGFDEGDLYGILGRRPVGFKPSFQVLTYGVWVQTYEQDLWPGEKIGGIICFDRLRKTADHSGFVKDERYEEMWLRLRPYCEEMITGVRKVVQLGVSASGEALDVVGLRHYLHEHERVVVVPSSIDSEAMQVARAESVSSALDAELLRLDGMEPGRIKALAGSDTEIYFPDVSDWADVTLYAQEAGEEPQRPWGASPVDLPTEELMDVLRDLLGEQAELTAAALVGQGKVVARLYAPRPEDTSGADLQVRLRVSGRELMRIDFPSSTPGHVLVVDVGDVVPSVLRAPAPGHERPLGYELAERYADRAADALAESSSRLLRGLVVGELEPGSPAARLAVAAVVQQAVPRLVTGSDGVRVSLTSMQDLDGVDPLDLPLLATLSGRRVSLRGVAELIAECGGVFYGVVPTVAADLTGLDRDRILDLDDLVERQLRLLFGDATYVRIDRRDVLAHFGEFVVRDVAAGLRAEPDFPLPLESKTDRSAHELLAEMDGPARGELLASLTAQLRDVWKDGGAVVRRAGVEEDVEDERREASRQAGRILQRFVCRQAADGASGHGIDALPLFASVAGTRHTLEELPASVDVAYGDEWAVGADAPRPGAPAEALLVSTWALAELSMVCTVVPIFEFHLDDDDALADPTTPDTAFLARLGVDEDDLAGIIGVPASQPAHVAIQLRDGSGRCVSTLRAWAEAYGAVGSLSVSRPWSAEEAEAVARQLHGLMESLVVELVAAMPGLEPDTEGHRRSLGILLGVASRALVLQEGSDGQVRASIRGGAAQRVLSSPLFPGRAGGHHSGLHFVHAYCRICAVDPAARPWTEALAEDADPQLVAWLEEHLRPERVGRQPGPPPSESPDWLAAAEPWVEPLNENVLGFNLNFWLGRLRPMDASGVEFAVSLEPPKKRGDGPIRARSDRTWLAYAAHVWNRAWANGVYPPTFTVRFDPQHPLVVQTMARGHESADWLAWMLLACYAELNTRLDPVSNRHEQEFQRAVIDSLQQGELRMLKPHFGG